MWRLRSAGEAPERILYNVLNPCRAEAQANRAEDIHLRRERRRTVNCFPLECEESFPVCRSISAEEPRIPMAKGGAQCRFGVDGG